MANGENWFGNLIMWWIGGIIFNIWQMIGMICALFGAWDVGYQGMMGVYKDFVVDTTLP